MVKQITADSAVNITMARHGKGWELHWTHSTAAALNQAGEMGCSG
jgi:hypothetical protein